MSSPRQVLIETLRDVDEANTPDDLREIAFAKLFDLRAGSVEAGSQAVPMAGVPHSAGSSTGATAPLGLGGTPGDELGAIAARVGIARETVAEVFTIHDGEVELIVPVGRLPTKTAAATKEIALLLAGGRQAARLEEFTSWDVIRKACSDFRKLDSANFAKTMREMDDVFSTRKESDRKYAVRLAKPGWERFGEAVRRFGGSD